MMTMTRRVLPLSLLLLALPAASQVPEPAAVPSPAVTPEAIAELPRVGEEFTYAVDYTGVVGAYIKVKVGEGPADHPGSRVLTAYLATTPLIQQIWRIRDKLMALYVPHQGRTVATRLWEEENGQRMFREEKFSADKIAVVEKRPDKHRTFDVKAEPPLLDAFSALFELRRRPLQPDTVEKARIYLNRKIFDCDARVSTETLIYEGEPVETLRVDPVLTHKGKPVEGVGFTFWLSNDAERVPLKIEADVRYGKLSGTLVPPEAGAEGPATEG